MNPTRPRLPPLNALVVFEAAGRLGSFSAAARELHMTQAAVSYGVKQLERALGIALFARNRQRVTLTDSGRRYLQDVTLALEHLRRSTEALRGHSGPRPVTLSCSTAFAAWWMLPRLARFREENPGIDLRLQTTDRDLDLAAEGVSLGIRRGDGNYPGLEALRLVDEVIIPVCSPAYLERAGTPAGIEDIARHRLIHLDEPFRQRPGWADYLRAQGARALPGDAGLHLNDYALVISAALDGQGIALGWRHQTDPLVARGLLANALELPWHTGLAFHIVRPLRAEAEAAVLRVRDWLAGNPPMPEPAWPSLPSR